jgi:hypothetical protein
MLSYASIFEKMFPRLLRIFEDVTNTLESNILNLNVYRDLDHLLIALKMEMKKDIKVMNGYC